MVASLLIEAARGAQLEVLRQATVWDRIAVATTLAVTFAKELVGIFANAPYGFHAMAMYRSVFYASTRGLADPRSGTGGSGSGGVDAEMRGAGVEGEVAGRDAAGDADSPSAARRSAIGIRKMRRQLTSTVWNWASSMEAMLWQGLPHGGVRVVYDIRYGPRPRNTLDIYMPPDMAATSDAAEQTTGESSSSTSDIGLNSSTTSSSSSITTNDMGLNSSTTSSSSSSNKRKGSGRGLPVLFFVHGGVWSSGEKWMYSPLAIRFAQAGAVVVTIQYTLYPEALAIDQVSEASAALTWAMDNIHRYGGDPSRIYLTGHSSGAHVCSMLVWRRFRSGLRKMFASRASDVASETAAESLAAAADSGRSGDSNGSSSSSSRSSKKNDLTAHAANSPKGEDLWGVDEADLRQPYCFLGMSGVYDISHHQQHEKNRGVFPLSAMSPAIGGPSRFISSSPALLFDALASAAAEAAGAADAAGAAAAAAEFKASFDCPTSPLLTAAASSALLAPASSALLAPAASSAVASTGAIRLEGGGRGKSKQAAISQALEELASISAAAAASLRPSLSAALRSSPQAPSARSSSNNTPAVDQANPPAATSAEGDSFRPTATSAGSGAGAVTPAVVSAEAVKQWQLDGASVAEGTEGVGGVEGAAINGRRRSGISAATAVGTSHSTPKSNTPGSTVADIVNHAGSKEAARQALRAHLLASSGQPIPAASPLQPAEELSVPPPLSFTSILNSTNTRTSTAETTATAGANAIPSVLPSSDSFGSPLLGDSPGPSALDILRVELGNGIAEAAVAALASGQLNLFSSSSFSSVSTTSLLSSSSSSVSTSPILSSSSSSSSRPSKTPSSTPLLPIVLLQCSTSDFVVPPETSLSLIRSLHRLNSFLRPTTSPSLLMLGAGRGEEEGGKGGEGVRIRAKVLVYDDTGHADFACWAVRGSGRGKVVGKERTGGDGGAGEATEARDVVDAGKELRETEEGEWRGGMLMRSKSMRRLSKGGEAGSADGEEEAERLGQVLSSGGASDEMVCVRDSLDIVTGRVSLEDMVWE